MGKKKAHNSAIPFIRRQYMSRPDYECFYYKDITLDMVAPHYHGNYELYFFLEGNVRYRVGEKDYDMKPGAFLLIPPNLIHNPIKIDESCPYRRFVLWLDRGFLDRLAVIIEDIDFGFNYAEKNKEYFYHPEYVQFNDLFSSLLEMWQEYNEDHIFKETTIINNIIAAVLKINRIVYNSGNIEKEKPKKELSTLVFDYINSHIAEDLTLENIANHFYVSKYHISHIFKNNLGISLHQYIIKKRLQNCRSAIASGESISSAAEKNGFDDYTVFYRAFKKEYGISPKDFRKANVLK